MAACIPGEPEGSLTFPLYRIVQGRSAEELQKLVQTSLLQGWLPQGGLSAHVSSPGVTRFAQAIFKPGA
jgi:hypothetical protein